MTWNDRTSFFDCPQPGPTIILAAHPDDEVIGATSVLTTLSTSVYLVFLTDGAPRDSALWSCAHSLSRSEYATLRWREAIAAMALANIPRERIFCLGGVDQESAQAVPLLVRRFAKVIADIRPDFIITHPYEGGHPDHDSAALVASMASAEAEPAPGLWEMTSYHARDGHFRCGQFLPEPSTPQAHFSVELSPEQRQVKRQMLLCYESQRSVLQAFVASMDEEAFRLAPDYDFAVPPHVGQLWYEAQGWAMSGQEWRRLATFLIQQRRLEKSLRCA